MYHEGKIRMKNWLKFFMTHFPIFCYKGLTVNFVGEGKIRMKKN